MEGRGGKDEGRGKEGNLGSKGKWGMEEEGEVGRNSALVVGDRRPWLSLLGSVENATI